MKTFVELMKQEFPDMTEQQRADVATLQEILDRWTVEMSPDEFREQLALLGAWWRTIADRRESGQTPEEAGMSEDDIIDVYRRLEEFRKKRGAS